jgi:hypothetical protein
MGTVDGWNRLTQERRIRMKPSVIQLADNTDALVERLARNEAGRAQAHPVALHAALQARALSRAQDRRAGKRRQSCRHTGHAGCI